MRRGYRGRFTKFESWFKEEHATLDDSELAAYFFLKHIADDEGRFEPKTKMLDTVSPKRFKGRWKGFLNKFKKTGHLIVIVLAFHNSSGPLRVNYPPEAGFKRSFTSLWRYLTC